MLGSNVEGLWGRGAELKEKEKEKKQQMIFFFLLYSSAVVLLFLWSVLFLFFDRKLKLADSQANSRWIN